jgi:hypothetical protein
LQIYIYTLHFSCVLCTHACVCLWVWCFSNWVFRFRNCIIPYNRLYMCQLNRNIRFTSTNWIRYHMDSIKSNKLIYFIYKYKWLPK